MDPPRPEPDPLAGAVRALRVITVGIGGVLAVLFAWVVTARFLHPIDAEWMTGAARDAVERVRDGEPLYAAPSASFIPFIYPPLYFWLSALFARVTTPFVACKLVSLGATAITLWGVVRISKALGASRFWTVLAGLMHLGAYSLTLYFYDLERVDALLGALVVTGLTLVLADEGSFARTAAGGAVLGLAFFAKQVGLLPFAAVGVALLLANQRRRGALVLASGLVVLVGVGVGAHLASDGWFSYYCLRLPRAHGAAPQLFSTFFVVDLPRAPVLGAGSLALAVSVVRAAACRRLHDLPWRDVVFGAVVGAAMLGAFVLRSHRGGWSNVLIVWTPLGCVAAAVAASRAVALGRGGRVASLVEIMLLAAVSLQLLGWAFDPTDIAPSAGDDRFARELEGLVRKLERRGSGDVVVTMTGNLTRVRHLHSAALYDVLRAGDPAPPDYLSGIRERRFAALLFGTPEDPGCQDVMPVCAEITDAVTANYFVAARLEAPEQPALVGYDGRPRWVLLPRRTPLEGVSREARAARQRAEAGLAEMRRHLAPPGATVDPNAPYEDIEDLAAPTAP